MRRVGSPPRMRGKLFERYILGNWVRITPADAGKTYSARHGAGQNRDHPRGCGENALRTPRQQEQGGSPPRMRGKRIDAGQLIAVAGITPADAGKTFRLSPAKIAAEDHPRGCGENDIENRIFVKKEGSPPRMRGKLHTMRLRPSGMRITPAGAGKTGVLGGLECVSWDHPRRCGENKEQRHWTIHQSGSPPQVRGKPASRVPSSSSDRITPAGAGKTAGRGAVSSGGKDHPRRCGENLHVGHSLSRQRGSPPQVRGKRFRKDSFGCSIWDHPRRCGENETGKDPTEL